jgi:hypothetical protein
MWRLIVLVMLFLGVGPALEYGSVWSLRAHPVPNVTVRLRDGRDVTGDLSRDWSKAWVLRTADGAETRFGERGYESMTFGPRSERHSASSGVAMLFASWRTLAPPGVLCAAALGFGLLARRRSLATRASRGEHG